MKKEELRKRLLNLSDEEKGFILETLSPSYDIMDAVSKLQTEVEELRQVIGSKGKKKGFLASLFEANEDEEGK